MSFSVTFIERKSGDSPSIERVFRCIADIVADQDISVQFQKLSYDNSFLGLLKNLLFFRPYTSDIYHITGHVNYMMLRTDPDITALTLHDATILQLRTGLRGWLIKQLYFRWPIRRAKYVTAISEKTRDVMTELANINSRSIEVIENPLLIYPESSASRFNSTKPTLLQIGTTPNKNLDRLIRAIESITCRLHIVGEIDEGICKLLIEKNIDHVNDPYLSDDQILEAYRECDLVMLCSINEGFGLPIIEGQAMMRPVITSNLSPMKEVAGDGALFVDPFDAESIREGVRSIISNEQLRTSLIENGRHNVKRFMPEAIAARYIDLYRRMLTETKK